MDCIRPRDVQQKLNCALSFQSSEPDNLSVEQVLQHNGRSSITDRLTALAVDLSIPI